MNRNELHHAINADYSPALGYGIEKGQLVKYKHVYFVVPRMPKILRS